jgi:hypothetical protein
MNPAIGATRSTFRGSSIAKIINNRPYKIEEGQSLPGLPFGLLCVLKCPFERISPNSGHGSP